MTTPKDAGPAVSARPKAGTDPGARALEWWTKLAHPERGDRAALARLRRARTTLEALTVRPAVTLVRSVGGAAGSAPTWRTRAALDLVRLLAHVREHDPSQHPMRAAGWKRFAGDRRESEAGDDRPRLSEARFRRFLQVRDGEERLDAFTRLVTFLDGRVKIDDLARDFMLWSDPRRGDQVRERWAFYYYAAHDAAPSSITDRTTLIRDDDE